MKIFVSFSAIFIFFLSLKSKFNITDFASASHCEQCIASNSMKKTVMILLPRVIYIFKIQPKLLTRTYAYAHARITPIPNVFNDFIWSAEFTNFIIECWAFCYGKRNCIVFCKHWELLLRLLCPESYYMLQYKWVLKHHYRLFLKKTKCRFGFYALYVLNWCVFRMTWICLKRTQCMFSRQFSSK